MNYLVIQDWPSTSGNHAGMRHMGEMLKCKYPSDYELVIMPNQGVKRHYSVISKLFFLISGVYYKLFFRLSNAEIKYMQISQYMFSSLKEGDRVFLLEYLIPSASQLYLAKYIKKNFKEVSVFALSHLTPSNTEACQSDMFVEWSKYADKMLTLGSSLSDFFVKKNIEAKKISTGFHYVDIDYYCNDKVSFPNGKLRVIAMGVLQRNFELLSEVCKKTKDVEWVICKGRADVDHYFSNCNNVILKGYLSEGDLRKEMASADVSFNVMEDTVGSNVITTSMAMGLAMVCSDVGSIRDYCTEENTLFCTNDVDSLVNSVLILSSDTQRVFEMKKKSLELSRRLSIEKVHEWFSFL